MGADHPQTAVHDHVALEEIELYGEVLSAVAGANHPLSQPEIDAVLGVRTGSGDVESALSRS